MKTERLFSAFMLFTYFKNRDGRLSISVQSSQVAVLSALSLLLWFPAFQMRLLLTFYFKPQLSENLCVSARKCNPAWNLAFRHHKCNESPASKMSVFLLQKIFLLFFPLSPAFSLLLWIKLHKKQAQFLEQVLSRTNSEMSMKNKVMIYFKIGKWKVSAKRSSLLTCKNMFTRMKTLL